MKKNLIILLVISSIISGYGQSYDMIYTNNPAFNTYLQVNTNEIMGSSTQAFIGYEGAPKLNVLNGDFGLNSHKNIGFNFNISQYNLADLTKSDIGLGYVYQLPESNWNLGLDFVYFWSKYDLSKIYSQDLFDRESLAKPTPGVQSNMGIFYGGDKFKFSLAGKTTIFGKSDLENIDNSMVSNIILDLGYKVIQSKKYYMLINAGVDVSDFKMFQSTKTLPIHIDMVNNIGSVQLLIRADIYNGMTIGISQQTKWFILFVNQRFPFLMFGDASGSIMTTEAGFGIRLGQKSGQPLPHLKKEGENYE